MKLQFFVLPPLHVGKIYYSGEDVLETLAEIKKVTPGMIESMIASGESLNVADFIEHDILIGKSFGEVVALKCNDATRFVTVAKYFKPGQVVALTTIGGYDEKPKKKDKKPKVSVEYRLLLKQMRSERPMA